MSISFFQVPAVVDHRTIPLAVITQEPYTPSEKQEGELPSLPPQAATSFEVGERVRLVGDVKAEWQGLAAEITKTPTGAGEGYLARIYPPNADPIDAKVEGSNLEAWNPNPLLRSHGELRIIESRMQFRSVHVGVVELQSLVLYHTDGSLVYAQELQDHPRASSGGTAPDYHHVREWMDWWIRDTIFPELFVNMGHVVPVGFDGKPLWVPRPDAREAGYRVMQQARKAASEQAIVDPLQIPDAQLKPLEDAPLATPEVPGATVSDVLGVPKGVRAGIVSMQGKPGKGGQS